MNRSKMASGPFEIRIVSRGVAQQSTALARAGLHRLGLIRVRRTKTQS